MRVLLIEDKLEFVDAIQQMLRRHAPETILTVARSRDGALALLAAEVFDLLLLDLRIPTKDGALDDDEEHGRSIFEHAREAGPGTPVWYLTAYGTQELARSLLDRSTQTDIWGSRENFPLVRMFNKASIDALIPEFERVYSVIQTTNSIELSTGGQPIALSTKEKRVLRIFARRRAGARAEIGLLSGGLSGSRVLSVRVLGPTGEERIHVAGKVDEFSKVIDEVRRFDLEVVRLPAGSFPTKIDVVEAGAARCSGVFYGLVSGHQRCAFDIARDDSRALGAFFGALREMYAAWQPVGEVQRTVRDIRRSSVDDETLEQLRATYAEPNDLHFESIGAQTKWGVRHGDLHGQNVLLTNDLRPMLIDFPNVGQAPGPIDPITLELSLVFHPAGRRATGEWLQVEAAERWHDISTYVANCPAKAFIEQCRSWAHAEAAGDREVYATAYAHALRQLKYADTDKQICLAVVKSCVKALLDTQ